MFSEARRDPASFKFRAPQQPERHPRAPIGTLVGGRPGLRKCAGSVRGPEDMSGPEMCFFRGPETSATFALPSVAKQHDVQFDCPRHDVGTMLLLRLGNYLADKIFVHKVGQYTGVFTALMHIVQDVIHVMAFRPQLVVRLALVNR